MFSFENQLPDDECSGRRGQKFEPISASSGGGFSRRLRSKFVLDPQLQLLRNAAGI
jgi:hypothetical protein